MVFNMMKELRAIGMTFVALSIASQAAALPFNNDMSDVQMKTGSIMRPKAPGSVPMGSVEQRLSFSDDLTGLKNPLEGDTLSTARGERLFQINCSPCHGNLMKIPYEQGAVSKKGGMMAAAPDLTLDMYRTNRTDGQIFKYIHFGGMAIMPGYGWKLSPTEHWDIVNFIRKAQTVVAKK